MPSRAVILQPPAASSYASLLNEWVFETAHFSDADLLNLVILMRVVLNPSINFNGIIKIKMKNQP